MARQVRWSHEAATDLESIAEYISKGFPLLRSRICGGNSCRYKFPRSFFHTWKGRSRGDDTVRELLVKGYRLLYKLGDGFVLIQAVIHGRRDIGRDREGAR